jgi:hypothetical protein
MILNFEKWKKLYEQTAPAAKGTKPAAPKAPTGYTSAKNGVAYKYPFADELALNKYSYFGSNSATINADGGGTRDEASFKSALKAISPKVADLPVNRTGDAVPAGMQVIRGVETMLRVAAQGGYGPMAPEQLVNGANALKDEVAAKSISDLIETLSYKKATEDFKANWPKIWAAQRKLAGLPETMS